MQIEIGEFQIRNYRENDAQALARYANNRAIARNLRNMFPHPYLISDAHNWIAIVMQQSPQADFAIASPTELIGSIGLKFQTDVNHRSAEIGYWLGEPFWGRGIATAALKALSEYAFVEHDLVRLYAHVYEWNPASARVLEKAGYSLEGRLRKNVSKDGQIIDELLYAKIRE